MPKTLFVLIVQNVLNDKDKAVWDSFVDLGGRSAQRLGMPRSLGQIYAALYLSPKALSLQDLMDQLHISKGNASMGVRQLASLGAVQQIWVKGDRRDYYEAKEDFRAILRHLVGVLLKPRMESTSNQLNTMKKELAASRGSLSTEGEFMGKRIARLQQFESKLHKLLPLAEKLL